MARRATRIKQEREKGGFVLVLDAGNSLVGDKDPARKTRGQTSITAMNMLGYDAMALGPKDLALGLKTMRQRIDQANFPLLSANAIISATGKPVTEPYVLRKFEGHIVAIVGLSGGGGTKEITLRDPLETARTVVTEAANKAGVIILLSHAGADMDQQIAASVPGIDLIVSGGAPALATAWSDNKTKTIVLRADQAQPGHAGRILGIAQLAFDPGGELVKQNWQRVPLGPEVADEPEMAAWVQQQTK